MDVGAHPVGEDAGRVEPGVAFVLNLHVPVDGACRVVAGQAGAGLVDGGLRIGFRVAEVDAGLVHADAERDPVGRVPGLFLELVAPAARVLQAHGPAVVRRGPGLHTAAGGGAVLAFHLGDVAAGVQVSEPVGAVRRGLGGGDGRTGFVAVRAGLVQAHGDAFDAVLGLADERVPVLVPPDGAGQAAHDHGGLGGPWDAFLRGVRMLDVVRADPHVVLVVFGVAGWFDGDGSGRCGDHHLPAVGLGAVLGLLDGGGHEDGADPALVLDLVPGFPRVVGRGEAVDVLDRVSEGGRGGVGRVDGRSRVHRVRALIGGGAHVVFVP